MLKAYWEQKSERDKKLLVVILSLLIFVLLFAGIWLPVHTKRNDLKEQITEQQQLLVLMSKQVPLLKELRTTQISTTNNDIFSLVEKQFKTLALLDPKLTLAKVADNKVSIQFSEIPFDDLIKQLVLLKKDFQITVDEFDAMRLEKQGMVSGKVILSL